MRFVTITGRWYRAVAPRRRLIVFERERRKRWLRARLGVLTAVFTPELVDEVIAKHRRVERRLRLLPSRLVVYFVLALCLFARESYEEVIGC